MMVARKTVPTVAVCLRSDRENREDFLPPFYYFSFWFFLPCCMLTLAIIFFDSFLVIVMFTVFGFLI